MAYVAERLDFRITPENKRLIEQAAAVQGQSVTDFALHTLCQRAKKVLRDQRVLVLSDRDRDRFLAALDRPPVPNAKLRRAAQRRRAARASGQLR